jgi:hypothetical protein
VIFESNTTKRQNFLGAELDSQIIAQKISPKRMSLKKTSLKRNIVQQDVARQLTIHPNSSQHKPDAKRPRQSRPFPARREAQQGIDRDHPAHTLGFSLHTLLDVLLDDTDIHSFGLTLLFLHVWCTPQGADPESVRGGHSRVPFEMEP